MIISEISTDIGYCNTYERYKFHAQQLSTTKVLLPRENAIVSHQCSDGVGYVSLSQLTKNVSGTFGFGCMKVWLNLTLLDRNVYVRHWSYKCLIELNVLKTFFKY